MKIVFEHQGRKTTILGNDYVTVVQKIRSLFPDQNDRPIQFYDPELTDFFEFTSYEQIIDQPNGLKMSFDMSNATDSFDIDPPPLFICHENDIIDKDEHLTKSGSKRCRRKTLLKPEDENDEEVTLPTYCDLIALGLQSRDSFPAIQKAFLEQTCAHFIQQYPDCSSRNVHHSFVLALTQKFPALNYLNLNVDGKNGKAPHHTISSLLSRKKRNIKYAKNHPAPKRQRLSTLDSSFNDKATQNIVVEEATKKIDAHDATINCDINSLIDELNINETPESSPEPSEQSTVLVLPPPQKIPVRPQNASKNDRYATIAVVPPSTSPIVTATPVSTSNSSIFDVLLDSASTSSFVNIPPVSTPATSIINTSFISNTPMTIKSNTTANAPTVIYHNGHIHPTQAPSQSTVAIHKAITPRVTTKKQRQNENNNSTIIKTSSTTQSDNILKPCTTDNVNGTSILQVNPEIWFPKVSKSEQSAYDKDVSRLRTILKPKNKSGSIISIGEINALIRNTHKIRRRILAQKQDADFNMKVLEHQEIFHEEALILEYTLLKDRMCTFEVVQNQARQLLDGFINKYSVEPQQQMTEGDFLAIKMFCEDAGEHQLFFKNGLTSPHPMIGIVIMSSSAREFEKAYMFVRNLPYKMPISIGGGGLHKVLALLLIMYIDLNDLPDHKLLQILYNQCGIKYF